MPLYKTQAIVLRNRRYKEADKLVTFYTRNLGKVTAVAKGISRSRSKYGSIGELLTTSDVVLYKKRDAPGLYTLTQGVVSGPRITLSQDLDRFHLAAYLAEVTQAVTHDDDSHPEIFDLLNSAAELVESNGTFHLLALAYPLQLIGLAGLAPHLDSCGNCGTKDEFPTYSFNVNTSSILCPNCRTNQAFPIDRGTLDFLRQARMGELAESCKTELRKRQWLEGFQLIREHLRFHLGWRSRAEKYVRDNFPAATD